MSTNLDPTAVQAAAERLLADRRAARIATAETALAHGTDALAEAQVARTNASRAMLSDTSDRARQDALAADDSARACGLRVEALEAELAAAKARTTPKEREAAAALVAARRQWDGLPARRKAHMDDVQAAATELIRVLGEGAALYLDSLHLGTELRDRTEQLGERVHDHAFHAASMQQIAASAILDACKAARFSPMDFRDLGRVVAADAAAGSHARSTQQFEPRPARTDEDRAQHTKQKKAWIEEQHSTAFANGLANTVEAQRSAGFVTGRQSVQNGSPDVATEADRTSLVAAE